MKRKFILPIIFLSIPIALVLCYLIFREKTPSNILYLYGNVDVREVDISFRVPGMVKELYYEEGDFVPAGSLLTILDKTPYDSEIRQAESNLAVAKSNLENAEILLKRRLSLIDIGGVSQEDVDNATASRNELIATVQSLQAALAVAWDHMKYTEVYAPTDGIILTRIREPGTVVNPTDPIYILSVISPVWVRAYVAEPDLGRIYYGMPAEILTDSKRVYGGNIGFISPMAEFTPKTVETTQLRTDLVYRLRIYANNPDQYLKQGMPVTVKLNTQ